MNADISERFKRISLLPFIFAGLWVNGFITAEAATYPEKPVKFVVPYAPSSSSDISARQLTTKLSEFLGQQVFVENRGGASGMVGCEAVAKSAPDGYTIIYANAQTHAINKSLFPKIPYDPVADFSAIGRISSLTLVLVVSPELPVKSVGELIAYVRAKPGQVNYASSGNGTTAHLSGYYFSKATGTEITHVPYNVVSQALADIASGRVSMMFYPYNPLRGAIQAGKLKLLATTGKSRSPSVPNLPTMIEAGVPGFVAITWNGLYAPAGTPRPVIGTLYGALMQTIKDPGVLKALDAGGYSPDPATPEEFSAFTKAEVARYADILKNANIKVD